MALDKKDSPSPSAGSEFRGRHLAIGTNVVMMVVLAVAVVTVLQWLAFYRSSKLDLTDQGVNSLSPGTELLLDGLDQQVRLTSMYFHTDLEDEDQGKYRGKIDDLLNLFQSANRSQIEIESFNPLQDHARRERFFQRLGDVEKFKKESEPHRALIDTFVNDLAGEMTDLINGELEAIDSVQNTVTAEEDKDDLGQLRGALSRWREQLDFTKLDVQEALGLSQPRYGTATSAISTLYSSFSKQLGNIIAFANQIRVRRPDMNPALAKFLAEAEDRYRPLIDRVDGEATKANELPRLEFEELARQVGPTSNALVVETQDDAKVVPFADIWPPVDPYMPSGAAAFKNRAFRGENKVASAILRLTQKEKTAVVFVRYLGAPLFMGGFMPGQPPAPYAQVKEMLEDANFVVEEWDVSSQKEPPKIDPPPVRTVFILLRPEQPPPGRQPNMQQPPFTGEHELRVREAMGDHPRAIFLAGWAPGPFGAMPAPYEYDNYLSQQWGIKVRYDLLLLQAVGVGPGQFRLGPQSIDMVDFSRSDHPVARGLRGKPAVYRLVAPLELAEDPPGEVTLNRLLWCEKNEGLWGVTSIQAYQQKIYDDYVVKEPEDVYGPFTIAAAGESGESKVVVIGSRECMEDRFAAGQQMVLTSQGLGVRPRNPGNIGLLLNALHWLNDNVEGLDVGKPVDTGTLEIDDGPTLTFIRWFAWGIWPAVALLGGGVAWWVRRR